MTTLKTCFKCKVEKARTDFYRHSQMRDGLLGKRKVCTRRDVAAHRLENLDKVRMYDEARAQLPHRIALRKSVVAKYVQQYPDRNRANNAVNNAVRGGRLEKQPCFICGSQKSVAHHPDYSSPLDVVWLCQAHHKQAHAIMREPA